MGKPRRKYTEEFKRDAVRMMRNRGTRTVAEVADDLGVGSNLLHRWASKTERDAVSKRNAEGETLEQEVRRLRKEVESLRLDKAILKNHPRESSHLLDEKLPPRYCGHGSGGAAGSFLETAAIPLKNMVQGLQRTWHW
jgi:transposase